MSVGMTKSDGSLTSTDFISADYNQDGKVSVIDALEILKYSLKMNATEAKWIFIEGDSDLNSLGRRDVGRKRDKAGSRYLVGCFWELSWTKSCGGRALHTH